MPLADGSDSGGCAMNVGVARAAWAKRGLVLTSGNVGSGQLEQERFDRRGKQSDDHDEDRRLTAVVVIVNVVGRPSQVVFGGGAKRWISDEHPQSNAGGAGEARGKSTTSMVSSGVDEALQILQTARPDLLISGSEHRHWARRHVHIPAAADAIARIICASADMDFVRAAVAGLGVDSARHGAASAAVAEKMRQATAGGAKGGGRAPAAGAAGAAAGGGGGGAAAAGPIAAPFDT